MNNIFFAQFILIVFSFSPVSARQTNATSKPALGGSGLMFTPNKGQIADMEGHLRPDVLYQGDGKAGSVYLRKTGFSYVFTDVNEVIARVNKEAERLELSGQLKGVSEKQKKEELIQNEMLRIHRVDMDFAGCKSTTETMNEEEAEGYVNYYYAHCPQGITHVKQYNKVTYKNIYDNIDIAYYGSKATGIKYDIIVKPHGDPSQLKLQWTGAQDAYIDKTGKLHIKTSLNEFEESLPKVYQNIDGKMVDVKAEYVLRKFEVSFKIASYRSDYPLIIDPWWATYFGGSNVDCGTGISVDNSGNAVISGTTKSNPFPVAGGGYSQPFAGNTDGFAAKFNPAGGRIWATYYGGTTAWTGFPAKPQTYFYGVAMDKSGDAFFVGNTNTTDFPVFAGTGYIQPFGGGVGFGGDALIVELDPNGVRLWATFYGGSSTEYGYSIATDLNGNVMITGDSYSTDIPLVGGGYSQPFYSHAVPPPNTGAAFIAKFKPSGQLTWATYFGGTGGCGGSGIATDNLGNILLTGSTTSTDFPVLTPAGAYNQNLIGSNINVYAAKFDPNGNQIWSTYYAGSGNGKMGDIGIAIAADNANNVVFTGFTSSTDFPVLAGYQMAYQVSAGGYDGFLVKFDPSGKRLWATYFEPLGVSVFTQGNTTVFDPNNNIYFLCEVEDLAGPTPGPCANNSIFNGNSATDPYTGAGSAPEDETIAKFTPSGQLICSSYLGGMGEDDLDNGGGIGIYGTSLYITAHTDGGFPNTAAGFQPAVAGNFDAYITTICTNICDAKNLDFSANTVSTCENTPITFTPVACGDTTGDMGVSWVFTGGTPATSTAMNPIVTYPAPGQYNVQMSITTICNNTRTASKPNYITITGPTASSPGGGPITCSTTNILLNGSSNPGGAAIFWNGGTLAPNAPDPVTITAGGTYTVSAKDANGCIGTATVVVAENIAQPNITATQNASAFCGFSNGIATVMASSGALYNYSWNSGAVGATASGLAQGIYTVTATDPANGCVSSTTATIQNANGPNATAQASNTCPGKTEGAIAITAGGTGDSFSWSSGMTTQNIDNLDPGSYTVTVTDGSGCTASTSATVSVFPNTLLTLSRDTSINKGQSVQLKASDTSPGVTYAWTPSASLNNSGIADPTASPLQTTTYTLLVTDADACTATDAVKITVNDIQIVNCDSVSIFVPTAFSPNGDGKNDLLFIRGGTCMSQMKFMVFDRWGELVFETTNPETTWDGTFKSTALETGVFIFYLSGTLHNGQSINKKGNITLLH